MRRREVGGDEEEGERVKRRISRKEEDAGPGAVWSAALDG